MKTFSPSIFCEVTQASLKEDAYNLTSQNTVAIRSILECEDDAILMEMNAKREYYLSLLESQKQGLGVIDEAVSGKVLAAIIAGIIAIIGALIAFITGNNSGGGGGGSSSSSSSSSSSTTSSPASTPAPSVSKMSSKDFDKGMKDPNSTLSFGNKGAEFKSTPDTSKKMVTNKVMDGGTEIDSTGMKIREDKKDLNKSQFNPFLYKKKNDVISSPKNVRVREFESIAKSMPPITVRDVKIPPLEVCSGNIPMIRTLKRVFEIMNALLNDIASSDKDLDSLSEEELVKEFPAFGEIVTLIGEFEQSYEADTDLNVSTYEKTLDNKVSIDAAEYLTKKFDCFDYSSVKDSRDGNVSINIVKLDKPTDLIDLKNALQALLNKANSVQYDANNPNAVKNFNIINSMLVDIRKAAIELSKDLRLVATMYYSVANSINAQINSASQDVINYITANYDSLPLEKARNVEYEKQYNRFMNKHESAFYDDDIAAIYESAYYPDTVISTDMDTSIMEEAELNQYLSMINEASERFSIYVHTNEMRAMNEEALIFSEEGISDYERFERLLAVQESLGAKIKRGWYNAVAAIKEIFRKFMEKLVGNFGTTKAYLDRYKDIILKSPFYNDTFKTQDLSLAIDRILNTECPAMDFTKFMVPDADDPVAFFKKFVRPNLKGVNLSTEPDPADGSGMGGINEFFKVYFCMQGHDTPITGPQFQKSINTYYNFLYDIRPIERSIKKSLKMIEDGAANTMKKAGVDHAKPPAEQPAATNTAPATTAPQESVVYSYLYQKYFTLSEDGILVEAEKVASDDNSNPNTNAAKPVVKNVADKGDVDDSGDIKNNARSTIDTKVKVYVDVCSALLKAKMSSCEFVRNECMQIIRNHVKNYIGNTDNQQQQQAQPQPQQQAQPEKEPEKTQPKRKGLLRRKK